MKLFNDFEAVKFPEENLIFITHSGYLYYIYNPERKRWIKYGNAGNDSITVSNYPDVSREELTAVMNGTFPQKQTDFMRMCHPSQLWIRDMMDLFREDFAGYMSDYGIHGTVHKVLLKSDICYKSFEALQKLLGDAAANHYENSKVIAQIKDLSFRIIGRDIFKKEIGIVDGHDSSSYFWIMPVRIVDHSNTDWVENVAEMRSSEISIEEDDVAQYLTPFLYKHFDNDLDANKQRIEGCWTDDDGNEQVQVVDGFEWYLTYNFFTYDSIEKILADIKDTVAALSEGRETEFTAKLKIKRGTATHQLLYAKNLTEKEIEEYNANRPTEDDTEVELVLDFYSRFIYRMEYMMKVGREKGYDLISFMGP